MRRTMHPRPNLGCSRSSYLESTAAEPGAAEFSAIYMRPWENVTGNETHSRWLSPSSNQIPLLKKQAKGPRFSGSGTGAGCTTLHQ